MEFDEKMVKKTNKLYKLVKKLKFTEQITT